MNRLLIVLFLSAFVLFSCKEDEPLQQEPTPNNAMLQLNLNLKYGADNLNIYDDVVVGTQAGNKDLEVRLVKFYLGNLSLTKGNNLTELSDIELIDFSKDANPQLTFELEESEYDGLSFHIGVPADLNSSNPATYDVSHPLSLDNDMYWSMITRYIFTKFEGWIVEADTTSVVYHIGKDDFLRTAELSKNISLINDSTTVVNLNVDVQKIFTANGGIDPSVDNESHSQDNKQALTTSVANNWLEVFSLE